MKLKTLSKIIVAGSFAFLVGCGANKGIVKFKVDEAEKAMPKSVSTQLDGFNFYFDEMPADAEKLGTIKTSTRTNAAFKNAEDPCYWVFYSALLDLKQKAQRLGGNAVGNIVSNWQNIETPSKTDYICDSGALMAGVALKGEVLKVGK